MRNVFLCLVLANLAFAAWHVWFSRPPRPVRAPDADVPSITLVSELPPELAELPSVSESAAAPDGAGGPVDAGAAEPVVQSSESDRGQSEAGGADAAAAAAGDTPSAPVAVTGGAPSVAAAGARCSSVGPFRELAQAATAAANLRAAGYQPAQRVGEGDIWIGYWVYIDAISTEQQANEILAKVRDEGVTDSYVIPNSDSGNLVSLGVFSEISGVSRRREEVRALGYEPKIVDRTRRATVYWVDVLLAPDQTLDFDSLQTPGRITRLEQRPCAAPAA